MKKLLLGVFVGLLILGITAPVWALEVTVGGEFRFRARQRTDFDLQAFDRNGEGGFFVGVDPLNGNKDLMTFDAPVGQLTYGGKGDIHHAAGSFFQHGPPLGTPFLAIDPNTYNNVTGQFISLLATPAARFWFDGTAAEEHFGYNQTTGLLNNMRATSFNNGRVLARPHGDAGNNDRDYLYDRVRISVDAKIVEGLRAYAMFENYSDWGLSRGNLPLANIPQNLGGDGSSSIFGDRAGMNVRFAWVDFVIPKTPVHVKIGRQPLALGHGILLDTRTWGGDMAYVYAPIGPVTVGAFYGKSVENSRSDSDDVSFWGLHADVAVNPTNKISTFYRFTWNPLTRYLPLGTLGAVGAAQVNRNMRYEQNQHGWGIAFDGKVGPFFYAAEADILWGQYTKWRENRVAKPWAYWDVMNAQTPIQFQENLYQVAWGYGVQLGVDFKWVKFDIAHSYGSGDRTRAASGRFYNWDGAAAGISSALNGFYVGGASTHQWTTGRRVEAFDAWLGDNMYSPWSTDIFMGSVKSANYGGLGLGTAGFTRRWFYGGEFGDLIMLKPTLAVKPLENLTADISYAVFWKASNTNSQAGGLGGAINPADGEATPLTLWKSNLNNRENPNKQKINRFLGQEINAHLTYYPYKNLMIKGWAGVFFPGDWFKVNQRSNNADSFFVGQAAFGLPIAAIGTGHDQVKLRPAWAMQLDVIVTF